MKNLTLSNLIGTLRSTFKIGKATFDASGVATARSIVVPDKSGTLALISDTIALEPLFSGEGEIICSNLGELVLGTDYVS